MLLLRAAVVAPLCLVGLAATVSAAEERPPNIVLLFADDLGYGDVACFNPQSKIPTPRIDALAREGMRLTHAYAGGAVCVPSRYALMTGRYAFRGAPLAWSRQPTIAAARATTASVLRDAGYATACVGKWHCGFRGGVQYQDEPLVGGPLDRGFGRFFGQHGSLDQPPYFYIRDRWAVEPATVPIAGTEDNTHSVVYQGRFWREGKVAPNFRHEEVLDRYTAEAERFLIEQHSAAPEQPFFLYFALTAPHGPWLPAQEFLGASEAGPLGDFVVNVDHVIGRILDKLEELGVDDDTIVLFSSDNGPLWFEGDVARYGHDSSGGLRGRKGDIWEGGVRVPLIARWPGVVPAGSTSEQVVSLIDLVATFADVAGEALPPDAGADSHSLLPALLGDEHAAPVRQSLVIYGDGPNDLAIRQGNWKYIPWLGSGGFLNPPARIEPAEGEPIGQLYNLRDDPGETRNVYAEHPEVVARLSAILASESAAETTHGRP